MNVKELRTYLKDYPDDAYVIVGSLYNKKQGEVSEIVNVCDNGPGVQLTIKPKGLQNDISEKLLEAICQGTKITPQDLDRNYSVDRYIKEFCWPR